MNRDIILPTLGMNQDSGIIVSWAKAPGDFVNVGDVVFEVETDKAVQEIASDHEGYLSRVKYEAGADVPVGEVIAVLTDEPEDAAASESEKPAAAAADEPSSAPAEEKEEQEAPPAKPVAAKQPEVSKASAPTHKTVDTGGKILASPKAKKLANEAGLDLNQLVLAGKSQPYHAADVVDFKMQPAAASQSGNMKSKLNARVSGEAFAELCNWLSRDDGGPDRAGVVAVLSAGAIRFATNLDEISSPLVVEVTTRTGPQMYVDLDLQGFSSMTPTSEAVTPLVTVHEMIDSNIVGVSLAGDAPIAISVFGSSVELEIELAFNESILPPHAAIQLISELAARLLQPMRQLL